jgi:hypothetical protein
MMTSTEMDALDEMRLLARKTAALARAAENILDDVIAVADEGRAKLEDLAHLLGATAEAAEATASAGVELERDAGTPRERREA